MTPNKVKMLPLPPTTIPPTITKDDAKSSCNGFLIIELRRFPLLLEPMIKEGNNQETNTINDTIIHDKRKNVTYLQSFHVGNSNSTNNIDDNYDKDYSGEVITSRNKRIQPFVGKIEQRVGGGRSRKKNDFSRPRAANVGYVKERVRIQIKRKATIESKDTMSYEDIQGKISMAFPNYRGLATLERFDGKMIFPETVEFYYGEMFVLREIVPEEQFLKNLKPNREKNVFSIRKKS